mmetsp:Transcript_24763/g.71031  ORF Transcript_24763/g.71031 Transcript_24763/m.71031 type:complete len:213 (-) Transcript_24763:574-1212(-)
MEARPRGHRPPVGPRRCHHAHISRAPGLQLVGRSGDPVPRSCGERESLRVRRGLRDVPVCVQGAADHHLLRRSGGHLVPPRRAAVHLRVCCSLGEAGDGHLGDGVVRRCSEHFHWHDRGADACQALSRERYRLRVARDLDLRLRDHRGERHGRLHQLRRFRTAPHLRFGYVVPCGPGHGKVELSRDRGVARQHRERAGHRRDRRWDRGLQFG